MKGYEEESDSRPQEAYRTAVDAEYPVIYHDGEGEEVEHVGKVGPHVRGSVFAYAFCVETVRLAANEHKQTQV